METNLRRVELGIYTNYISILFLKPQTSLNVFNYNMKLLQLNYFMSNLYLKSTWEFNQVSTNTEASTRPSCRTHAWNISV